MMLQVSGPRHRLSVSRTAVVFGVIGTFAVGTTSGWGLERFLNAGIDAATPDLHVSLFADPESFRPYDVVVPVRSSALVGTEVPANRGSDITLWAEKMDGAAADEVTFDLEIYGQTNHPVIVNGMRATPTCSDAPEVATHFVLGQSGPFEGKVVRFDLDAKGAIGASDGIWHASGDREEWEFPLQVSQAEAEHIVVIAATNRSCEFEVEVDYSSGGKRRTATVDDDGSPFKVQSSVNARDSLNWEIHQRPTGDMFVRSTD